jgi:hypothetical protein
MSRGRDDIAHLSEVEILRSAAEVEVKRLFELSGRRFWAPSQRPRRSTVTVVASASKTETLVCTVCSASFERVRTRGRKPHACPACREAAESPAAAAM